MYANANCQKLKQNIKTMKADVYMLKRMYFVAKHFIISLMASTKNENYIQSEQSRNIKNYVYTEKGTFAMQWFDDKEEN